MSDEQDWRLKVELDASVDAGKGVSRLFPDLRGGGDPDVVHELESAVPHDVVLTHDGKLLFAYAADEATLTATRRAIEGVLARENMKAISSSATGTSSSTTGARPTRRRAPQMFKASGCRT